MAKARLGAEDYWADEIAKGMPPHGPLHILLRRMRHWRSTWTN